MLGDLRRGVRGLPRVYWQLIVGLLIAMLLAPWSDDTVDVLRVVEIGMSVAIVVMLIDWAVHFHIRYKAGEPTAATPRIVWMMVVAYTVALAGNTQQVLENYQGDVDALHPPLVFGFFAQVAALAWIVPFLAKLHREGPNGTGT